MVRNLLPESKKEAQKFLLSKMPRNAVIDPNRVDDLVLGGGLKQDTLKRRERAYKALDDFLRAQYQVTADDALKSSQLEDVLMSYFESLRVQQKDDKGELVDVVPKQRTLDAFKSNLKLEVLQKTGNKVDIETLRRSECANRAQKVSIKQPTRSQQTMLSRVLRNSCKT